MEKNNNNNYVLDICFEPFVGEDANDDKKYEVCRKILKEETFFDDKFLLSEYVHCQVSMPYIPRVGEILCISTEKNYYEVEIDDIRYYVGGEEHEEIIIYCKEF